jgi:hypothetical protein
MLGHDANSPGSDSARIDRWIALALLAAGAAGYGVIAWFHREPSADGFAYLALAKNFFHGGYEIDGVPHTKFLPLYPFLMALGNAASLHYFSFEFVGYTISVISGASLAPLTYLMARQRRVRRLYSLLAALIILGSVVNIFHSVNIHVTSFFSALLTLALWLLFREDFFPAGLVLGLAAITRNEAYLFLPLVAAANLRNVRRLAAAGVGLAIPLAPWWIHNILLFGKLNPSAYFVELFYFRNHFWAILIDMLLFIGPVAMAASVIGIFRAAHPWRLYFGGYLALYLALHLVWWHYSARFLLPIMPLMLVAAAQGLDGPPGRFTAFLAGRRRLRAALIALALVLPPLTLDAIIIVKLSGRPPEPIRQAAMFLADKPRDQAVLASNYWLISYYSGLPTCSLDDLPAGEDPNLFVLQQYLDHNVRYIVWVERPVMDMTRFIFLKAAHNQTAVVETPAGKYEITYLLIQQFKSGAGGGANALLYYIMVSRISPQEK